MVWTASLDAIIGAYTKASDYDKLVANVEYLQTLANVDHDFHVSTGTGKHKTIQFLADSTYNVGSSSVRALGVYTDILGDSGQQLALNSSSVRMANAPAFLAYNSASDDNVTGDNTVVTVDFDTEVFDQGGNFSADTFTAPVAGRYQLNVTVGLNGLTSAHTVVDLVIVTSNRTYQVSNTHFNITNAFGNTELTGAVLADMDAADTAYVTVAVYNGTKVVDIAGVAGAIHYTTFSGFMAV